MPRHPLGHASNIAVDRDVVDAHSQGRDVLVIGAGARGIVNGVGHRYGAIEDGPVVEAQCYQTLPRCMTWKGEPAC